MARKIKPGDVVVIRYEGPEGRARHAGDAGADVGADRPGPRRVGRASSPTAASPAARGAWSSATSRPRRTSAARSRSCRKATRSRSTRTSCCIQLNVDDAELARRRAAWKPPKPRYTRGLLAKYMRLVSTASKGAITDGRRAVRRLVAIAVGAALAALPPRACRRLPAPRRRPPRGACRPAPAARPRAAPRRADRQSRDSSRPRPAGAATIPKAGSRTSTRATRRIASRVDTADPHGGARSLRIENIGPEPYGAITQSIDARPLSRQGRAALRRGCARASTDERAR